MDLSVIPSILRELNIPEDHVVNIYNYGSWVYGTNSPTSDRDLMIITRFRNVRPLTFNGEFDYFHEFELHKLWNQYDVCLYSVENFETLLEKNYLLAVECTFLPDEFKIKEEIDFQKIYLEKYYDQTRLRKVAFYENYVAKKMYDLDDYSKYPKRSSTSDQTSQSSRDYLFKILFHGFRYLDFAEQLIRTKSIHDFKSVSHVFDKLKEIRGDPVEDLERESVLEYFVEKSAEYKSKLDALVPSTTIKGTFEAHVTFACPDECEAMIENLKKVCKKTKYKIIFIDMNTHVPNQKLQQLMTSSYHCGEYPSIVKQIEEEVSQHFRDFDIIRIKIGSLATNEGVPVTDLDIKLFWDDETNYFEFHYKVLVKENSKEENLTKLRNVCQLDYRFQLHLSRNAFKQTNENEYHYMITKRFFDVDRETVFQQNDEIVEFLSKQNFAPLKVVRAFVVYDTHVELDDGWN